MHDQLKFSCHSLKPRLLVLLFIVGKAERNDPKTLNLDVVLTLHIHYPHLLP